MNQVIEFFTKLFDYADWPPRWHCGKWSEFHGWLYIISDLLIWSAYFTIPLVIIKYISRRSDAEFVKLYFLFAAFILACGATHFLDAISFWYPMYRLNALVRLITGALSWITVFYIIRYLPLAFSLRSQKALQAEIEYRKLAETNLSNSEEQVEAIFNNAPDAVVVINSKGNVVRWNPAAEKMFGWTKEEITGKVLNEVVVPEELQAGFIEEMKNFLKTGQSQTLNNTILQKVIRKDKTTLVVEFTAAPIEVSDDFLFIGFVRDATEKRKGEEALRLSTERYRLLTSEVYDYAIMMLSPEGNISSWNGGAQKIMGYEEDEILGKNFSIFYTAEANDRNFPMEELGIVAREGRVEDEGWRVKKDGSLFWANVVMTALKSNGKIIGYSKITRDITERKKAEEEIKLLNTSLEQRVVERTEELQISEKKYRKLFENSPMPMWVLELPGLQFIDVNEAAIIHYGYSREEFLSMTAVDIRPEDEKQRFLQLDRSAITGVMQSGVWKHIKKDRSIIYVQVSSHQLNIDTKLARLVLSIDVTERRKAEQRLDIALEAGKIGIWELDMLKDISVRNTRHDQIYGYDQPKEHWGMKDFLSHIYPDDLANVQKAFENSLIGGSLYVETRILTKNKSVRWIIATGKIMQDNVENPFKMLGTVTDITELKIAEERIRILNNDLEQRVQLRTRELNLANKELESFSYSVSHDLRAPLRAIHGYSQLLNENYSAGLDDEGKRMLGRVMHNTKKMGQLIDDLLEFSRLGKAAVRKEEINFTAVAEEVVLELSQTFNNFHHKIVVQDLGTALADRVIIRHVMENLLLNAIKYSAKKESPEVLIGVTETKRGTTYFVKDNGAGFDMAYYDKLFGVFQRLHRQEEFEGTGVGLAIVQKIISKHRGEVWAEAAVNKGATFFFTLGK
ncbi:MAG: PAS domain S-box protein [Bacteroidota bacterium]